MTVEHLEKTCPVNSVCLREERFCLSCLEEHAGCISKAAVFTYTLSSWVLYSSVITVFEQCVILCPGTGHRRTIAQGLNVQSDEGIENRDIFAVF